MALVCLDCPPGPPAGEAEQCPKSKKPCGHHCDHEWTHDTCCWCGKSWGENGEPSFAESNQELIDQGVVEH